MEIINNSKKFKVIKVSSNDRITLNWGDICMHCNNKYNTPMYFVAALNDILCEECYHKWYESAIRYEEDSKIESYIFKNTLIQLGVTD